MPISIDGKGPLDAVNEMLKAIHDMPTKMAEELTAWQLEDLNRKPENVRTDQVENSVLTTVTEHTQGEYTHGPAQQIWHKKARKQWKPRAPRSQWHHFKKK